MKNAKRKLSAGMVALKQSGISGKTRQFRIVREHGERVECIADDNGRTIIVSRTRLHAQSNVLVASDCLGSSAELALALDLLLSQGK